MYTKKKAQPPQQQIMFYWRPSWKMILVLLIWIFKKHLGAWRILHFRYDSFLSWVNIVSTFSWYVKRFVEIKKIKLLFSIHTLLVLQQSHLMSNFVICTCSHAYIFKISKYTVDGSAGNGWLKNGEWRIMKD